jgi:hypothetical protein
MAADYVFSYTTIDLTNPASTVTDPAGGAVLNASSSDPYTITGTATDNVAVSSIEVSTDGGAMWNPAVCTGCGTTSATWTYSWTLPADGTYTIQSRATDSAGNVETPSGGNTVTVDRTAPSVSSTNPADGANNITLNNNVLISWNESIDCATVNTTNITSDSPGWSLSSCSGSQAVFTTAGQNDATTYTVTIATSVTDAAGNPMSAPYSFSYTTEDLTPAQSTISNPADSTYINASSADPYTITGTATDNAAVSSVEVSTDGGATWSAAVCTGCGTASATWSYSWTLPADGTYVIKSRATDSASNVETPSGGNTVTVDRTAPSVSSTTPANGTTGITVNSDITIVWDENIDCTTVNTTSVTINPAVPMTISNCSGSQATFTTNSQSGSTIYTVTVSSSVTDTAGNTMSSNYQFSYTTEDLGIPSSSITDPADGSMMNMFASDPYTITGTATDNTAVQGIEISINGGPWLPATTCTGCPGTSVTWTYDWTLPSDGNYIIQSRASDTSGNTEVPAAGINITVDRTPPDYIWQTPADSLYYADGDSITIDADVSESGSGISDGANCNAKIDGSASSFTGVISYSSTTQKCTGTLTLKSPSGLTDGAHNLTLEIIDVAGNYTVGISRTLNLDNSAPTTSIVDPTNGAVFNNTTPDPYVITGTSSDNIVVAGIEVSTDGGSTWNAASCASCPASNVSWTYTWNLPSDGTYNILTRAADGTGNVEMPGTGISVTVERTGPSVVSTVPANAATNVILNSDVTINWSENVDCSTVNTTNIYIDSGAWSLSTCSGNQAVFTTGSQLNLTTYSVTVTTGVKDLSGNPMAVPYGFSYTTGASDTPALSYPAAPFDNGLDPDSGDTTTTFTFKVIYTDAQNDPPAAGYPMVFIGDDDGYYGYTMTEEDPLDTTYSDGKVYYYSAGFGASADIRYFFESQAASGDTTVVTLPSGSSAYLTGPSVYLLAEYNLVGVPKDLRCNCRTYVGMLDTTGSQYCVYWDSFGPDPAGGQWIDNTSGLILTGKGYFIWAVDNLRRLNEPEPAPFGIGNDPSPYIDIPLDGDGGWTMITNPYNSFIDLKDTFIVRGGTEYTFADAVTNGWVNNSIYEWEGSGPGYSFKAFNGSTPATLEPWMGYYIYVRDSVATTLRIYAP